MAELPQGLGRFEAGELSFVVDDGYSLVTGAERELDEQSLDARFPPRPSFASWLLARLKRLAAGSLALEEETVEICDGAVYVIDFVVRAKDAPAGKVQLQAGGEGAALLGVVSLDPELVIDRFVAAIAADPEDVARCRVRVRDPAWREDRVAEYGWDGSRYL